MPQNSAMKLAITSLLFLCSVATAAGDDASLTVGQGRGLIADEDTNAMINAMAAVDLLVNVDFRKLVEGNDTHIPSIHDKMDMLIKNVDCAACMEAPELIPIRKLGEEPSDRRLSPKDVFVTALNCNTNDAYQIWNLISLETSGIWYLFQSAETGECMQVIGDCSPDGSLYDIETGPCSAENSKAIWAFTGVGNIVNFECFRSNWESDNLHHSTPDIFLEASCGNQGGVDRLDLSSHSADSKDQAENVWMLYPKSFGNLPTNLATP